LTPGFYRIKYYITHCPLLSKLLMMRVVFKSPRFPIRKPVAEADPKNNGHQATPVPGIRKKRTLQLLGF
jgi:hypothetical protein